MDCLSFNLANRADVPASEFYWMKGFFITPLEANGEGPQVTIATVKDQLLLQARVYNYSLVDTGAGVRVQFYGQEVDQHGVFTGSSFFIGEDALAAIPGFNDPTSNGKIPNWVLAGTTFDTTNYLDTYLVFWVVVWIEQGNSLVAEITDHGLSMIPLPNLQSISEVPIEPHSNNVSYYRQPLYIAPQTSTQAVSARAATAGADEGVSVETVQAAPTQVGPDGKVQVRATLRAGATAADGVPVFFYDRDPKAGGKAFDIELIPRIRAQDRYTTQGRFQPRTCGQHTLFVVAAPGAATAAEGMATVEVSIDAVAGVPSLRRATEAAGLPQRIKKSLMAKLRAAQKSFRKDNTTAGFRQLRAFRHQVNAQSGNHIPTATAQGLLAKLDRIVGCIEE
ncbi:MAG: FIMAH domain-containing protein [Methylococcales bacterium]